MRALFRLNSSCRPRQPLPFATLHGSRDPVRVACIPVGFSAAGSATVSATRRSASSYSSYVSPPCGQLTFHLTSTVEIGCNSWSTIRTKGSGSSIGIARPKSRCRATATTQMNAPPAVKGPTGMDADTGVPRALPKACVRAPPGSETLAVSISLGPKTCNLNRPIDEPLDKALTRLAKNLMTKPSKKEKRKKPGNTEAGVGVGGPDTSTDDPGPPNAVLYEDMEGTRAIDRSLPNGVAWMRGAMLEVAGERLTLEINPPTVDKLTIDGLAMVGYPTAAAVTVSCADAAACQWRWSAQGRSNGSSRGSCEWVDLGCSRQYYTPTAADEGCVLKVECTPVGVRRWRQQPQPPAGGGAADSDSREIAATATAVVGEDGDEELWLGETVSTMTGPVQRGPDTCSATIRCVHTPTAVHPPGFRILSYNILADQYAGSDYAQDVLFNYCPKECLNPGYRRPLVLRELLGYQADVICLQEVDERAFSDFLTLHLGLQGYAGHYTNKQGKVREGSATFWRTSRFTALAHHDIRLRESFARPMPPLHAQFEPLLAASKELATALQRVTTIAQATLLAPREEQRSDEGGGGCCCVLNTHLFFHPYAPHIRTMHTAAILEEAAAFLERCAADPKIADVLQGRRPTVLFVGDLNSDLNDGIPGVVELLRRGKLPADYWDWVQGAAFKWGMGEEDAEAMAQATAQIAAAAATQKSAATATAASQDVPATAAATTATAADTAAAAAAASVSSLFAPDGHAFDSVAGALQSPITITGIDITAPFVLRSADDLATPYTNYTSGYKALLDYVWYEESALRVVQSAPVPTEAELGSFIPSPAFPSDHLAVVYDMEWRREGA